MYRLLACAFVIAGASTAQAQQTTAPQPSDSAMVPPTATASTAPDPNEIVCEYEAPETGTLLGRVKVCKTRKQWDVDQKQTQVGQDLHHALPTSAAVNSH